jgi:hypothetical protein
MIKNEISPAELINISPLNINNLIINNEINDFTDEYNDIDLLLKKNDIISNNLTKELIYNKLSHINKINLTREKKYKILIDLYIKEELIDISFKIYTYKLINIINDTKCMNYDDLNTIINFIKISFLIQHDNNKNNIHFTNRMCYNNVYFYDIMNIFDNRIFSDKSNIQKELTSLIKNNDYFNSNEKIIIILMTSSIDNYDNLIIMLKKNNNKNLYIKIILLTTDIDIINKFDNLKNIFKFVDIFYKSYYTTQNIINYQEKLNNDFYKFLIKGIEKYQSIIEMREQNDCIYCNTF